MSELDIEREVKGLEAKVGSIRAQARACVERFVAVQDESVAYLLAERLGGLGSLIVDDLYALVLDNPSSTPFQRYLAAWLAIRAGDRGRAVDHLCDLVSSGSPYALYAANVLSTFGLAQGLEAVTAGIAKVDPDHVTELLEWGSALRRLGGQLPEQVRRQLEARTDHWAARATLADFPEDDRAVGPGEDIRTVEAD